MSAPDNNQPPQWAKDALSAILQTGLLLGDDVYWSLNKDVLARMIARHAPKPDINAELAGALEKAEKYLVERGIEHRGVIGRTEVLPAIRAALHKYKESTK